MLKKHIEIGSLIVVFLLLFSLITIFVQYLFLLYLLKSINHSGVSIIDFYKITISFNLSIFSGSLGEKREIVFNH